jgi:zinc transport system substrate-binding protein
MEPWAERILRSRDPRETVVVEAVEGIPLLGDVPEISGAQGKPHSHPESGRKGGREHGHESGNPHVWLDPVWAQDICRRIAQALIRVDPDHRATYESNLHGYLGELEGLHREIQARVTRFRIREYVCFHPAYAYFSQRYGLREVGVIELSPGREPSPRHLQGIVAAIRKHRIRVVFAEPQLSARVAEVIAREAGVSVAFLDPLGGRPPYGSDYIRMMRHNLEVLEKAMGGE